MVRKNFILTIALLLVLLQIQTFIKNLNSATIFGLSDKTSLVLVNIGDVTKLPHGSQYLGNIGNNQELNIDIALNPQDPIALETFVKEVSSPDSPKYHQYLPPNQFGPRFGATSQSISSVLSYLKSIDIISQRVSQNKLLIHVSSKAQALENSLKVKLENFRVPNGRVVMANVAPVMVPREIAGYIKGIIGLDNIDQMKPQIDLNNSVKPVLSNATISNSSGPQACNAAVTSAASPPTPPGAITPLPAYTINEIASAYGFNTAYAKGDLGTGETIGLFELEDFSSNDVAEYETCYGINANINKVLVDGGPPATQGMSGEGTMDVELVASFAPSSQIEVYEAPLSQTGYIDELSRMAADDSAKVISNSWGICESQNSIINLANFTTGEYIFEQMAAQGQGFFSASGDTGSQGCLRGESGSFVISDSCPTPTFCMTSDAGGNVYTFDGSKWSFQFNPTGGTPLMISCVNQSKCVGVDAGGNAYVWQNGIWSQPDPIDASSFFTGISCANDNFCAAIDFSGNAFTYNGLNWSAPTAIEFFNQLSGISCTSSSFCVAVANSDSTFIWNGSTWSFPININNPYAELEAVSCLSPTYCMAVDVFGLTTIFNGYSWSTPTLTTIGFSSLYSVSCPQVGFCITVDSKGIAYVDVNGVFSHQDVDGNSSLSIVTCASSSFCQLIDSKDNIITYTGSSFSPPQLVAGGNTSLQVIWPASSPYVTAVGGTTLQSDTSPPQEEAWNNGISTPYGGAGGGGISTVFQMPSWQFDSGVNGVINAYSSNLPCSSPSGTYCREVPDVSASADWYQGGYIIYENGNWEINGGTSASTPLWASLTALTNEYCGLNIGFANPLLYSIDAADTSAFNNIQSGNIDFSRTAYGIYPTSSGSQTYSMATGLGSPNGTSFMNDACHLASIVNAPVITSITPNIGPASGGTTVSIFGSGFVNVTNVSFGTAQGLALKMTSPNSLSVVAPAGTGTVDITVSNSFGTSSLNPNDKFTFEDKQPFHPLSPIRICDTRPDQNGVSSNECNNGGSGGTLLSNSILRVSIPSTLGISNATAVVVNVTATDSAAPSYLTIFPAGESMPTASNLNFTSGTTVTNLVTVALGSSGAFDVYNYLGQVDVVIDLEGYYGPDSSGNAGMYTPIPPQRICDSRIVQGGVSPNQCNQSQNGPIGPGGLETIQVTGTGGIPATGVKAVSLNLTAISPTQQGFLTAFPSNQGLPNVSNVNFVQSQTVPNRAIVELSPTGTITIYNASGFTNIAIDINGWFSDGSTTPPNGVLFTPISPSRICDTRSVQNGVSATQCNVSPNNQLGPSSKMTVQLAYIVSAKAIVANTTITDTSSTSYLTIFPGGTLPTVSDLNWTAGDTKANLCFMTLSTSDSFTVYNYTGTVDIIIDLEGYYS